MESAPIEIWAAVSKGDVDDTTGGLKFERKFAE